jgi:hypothetical protein
MAVSGSSSVSRHAVDPVQRFVYFAYGSNMSISQLRERVDSSDQKAIVLGRAILEDYQLVFNKKSVFHQLNGQRVALLNGKANIEKSVDSSVSGVLFSLTKDQVAIMDQCEGARLNPPHYQRKIVSVEMVDGQNEGISTTAITYVANVLFTTQGYIKPTDEYLNTIFVGARENGIDINPIERAASNLN